MRNLLWISLLFLFSCNNQRVQVNVPLKDSAGLPDSIQHKTLPDTLNGKPLWRLANNVFDTLPINELEDRYIVSGDTFPKDTISKEEWYNRDGPNFISHSAALNQRLRVFINEVAVKQSYVLPGAWVEHLRDQKIGRLALAELPVIFRNYFHESVVPDSVYFLVQDGNFEGDGHPEILLKMHGSWPFVTYGYLLRKYAGAWMLRAVFAQSTRGVPIDTFHLAPGGKMIWVYDAGWGTCFGAKSVKVYKLYHGSWRKALEMPLSQWACLPNDMYLEHSLDGNILKIDSATIEASYRYRIGESSENESKVSVYTSAVHAIQWNWNEQQGSYQPVEGLDYCNLLMPRGRVDFSALDYLFDKTTPELKAFRRQGTPVQRKMIEQIFREQAGD